MEISIWTRTKPPELSSKGLAESRYPSFLPPCILRIHWVRNIGSSIRQDNALEEGRMSDSLRKAQYISHTCDSVIGRTAAVRRKFAAAIVIVAGTFIAALDVGRVIGTRSRDVCSPCSRAVASRYADARTACAATIDGGVGRGEYGEERDDGEVAHSSKCFGGLYRNSKDCYALRKKCFNKPPLNSNS